MIHRPRLAIGGAVLFAMGVAIAGWSLVAPGPMYSVAAVCDGLASDPTRWVGNTVDVRAVVTFATTSSASFDPFHPPPHTSVTYALWQPALQGVRIATIGPPLTVRLPAGGRIATTRGNTLVSHIRSFVTRVAPRLATLFPALSAVPVARVTLLTTQGRPCVAAGRPVARLDALSNP